MCFVQSLLSLSNDSINQLRSDHLLARLHALASIIAAATSCSHHMLLKILIPKEICRRVTALCIMVLRLTAIEVVVHTRDVEGSFATICSKLIADSIPVAL